MNHILRDLITAGVDFQTQTYGRQVSRAGQASRHAGGERGGDAPWQAAPRRYVLTGTARWPAIEEMHPEALDHRPAVGRSVAGGARVRCPVPYGTTRWPAPSVACCLTPGVRTIANCRLNGDVGEIGVACALGGYFGIPTVHHGDRAAVDEARRHVPEIEGVIVKEGLTHRRRDDGAGQGEVLREAPAAPWARSRGEALYRGGSASLPQYAAGTADYWPPARRRKCDLHTVEIHGDDLLEVMRRR